MVRDDDGAVAIYALPYLHPDVTRELVGADASSHAAVVGAAMQSARADLATRADVKRSVVVAHAFVVGGEACESERDVSVGGVSTVPLAAFGEVSYAALGHLHGRQMLAPHIRYSGSPLAFSFSEHQHTKSCWLVDLGRDGVTA